jgi:hypothetical protein
MISVFASILSLASLATSTSLVDPSDDTTAVTPRPPPRIYMTERVTGRRPVIDGKLDDACWETGVWAGDFVQWIPNEGAKPSQQTHLKVFYDDYAIYVAVRAIDSEPDRISRKAGARDAYIGDVVGVCFDSYHDYRTGFEFDLTAAGQKIDGVFTNPMNPDNNWNPVWEGKVGEEDSAWTAEFAVPLSQLRYSSEDKQIWGFHCWRWIDRVQEESDWEPQSSTGPGMLYLFGELHGLQSLPASRRIEIMPFALGKLKTFQAEPSNPFARNGIQPLGNVGLDAKIGLASNFTGDLTINPDFGQVEADPSAMNLSVYETFYEEKRPFFLEGKNIFSIDFDNVSMFYSRRVGHAPSYAPPLTGGAYMKFPDYTSILGALKVSGKTAGGLAVGVFEGLTARESATVWDGERQTEVAVEPLTSASVLRLQQDFDGGNTFVGGMLTATNRFIADPHLEFLNRSAYTGGLDLLHQWNDKEFFVSGKLVASTIAGSSNAITDLQMASARYYQRPDVSYVEFDDTRTRLSGYGGEVKIGKGSKGLWRYSTQLDWRSPGLDLNDLGYMQTADLIKVTNSVSYFVNRPIGIFRTYSVSANQASLWNFGMHALGTSIGTTLYGEFLNNLALSASVNYSFEALDPRILRGGPAMLVPNIWSIATTFRTDPSLPVVFLISHSSTLLGDAGGKFLSLNPSLSFTPTATLRIAIGLTYSSGIDNLQYVSTPVVDGTAQYLLGRIESKSFGATFRTDWNITNTVSLQYYGSPFGSVGAYSQFKVVSSPRASGYNERYTALDPTFEGGMYAVYPEGGSAPVMVFSNPDFTFGQFRSVLVFRWEYIPGSQVYLVWTQERTRYMRPDDGSPGSAIQSLGKTPPANVFLMKMSYWFAI